MAKEFGRVINGGARFCPPYVKFCLSVCFVQVCYYGYYFVEF